MWDEVFCYCTDVGKCASCLMKTDPFDRVFSLDEADRDRLKDAMILDGVPEDCHWFAPTSGLFYGVPPLSNIMYVLRHYRLIPRWTYKSSMYCISINTHPPL